MSTLLEIRQQFVKQSGRYDLATTTTAQFDTDAGANFFIQSGSIDLDLEQNVEKTNEYYDEAQAVGEYYLKMTNCRGVEKVYIKDAAGTYTELTHKFMDELTELYPELEASDTGTPAYWAEYPLSNVATELEYKGVIFMPPTDAVATIRVFGRFHSLPLTINTSKNYWSVNYPHVLVLAALRALEGSYRNTQGYNDYDLQIQKALHGIDNDQVDIASDMEMNG